jgi:glycosyltransferase involved in cell wall biosynthesis
MAEAGVIGDASEAAIRQKQIADVLIAIPTFNYESTIEPLLTAVRTALLQFPNWKAIIALVDGGSSDSTLERARNIAGTMPLRQTSYPVYPVHRLDILHHSLPGKESAYRTIFVMAAELEAKVCCIIGGDAAVTPDWIASLVQPVLESGFDLAVPLYQRQKYEGFLVNSLLYPRVRALYGKDISHPIGGHGAYSRALIRRCLSFETWDMEPARRDVDLWINLKALQDDLKICQVRLGPRPRSSKSVPQNVSEIVSGLTGALYIEMESTAELWQRIRGSIRVPVFGLRFDPSAPSDAHAPDTHALIETFRIGSENLQDIWGMVMSPVALLDVKRMSRQSGREFRFAPELWARIVYDFAVAHRLRPIGRDHLLRAVTPLYMGWVASFIHSLQESDTVQPENKIEEVCMAYESQKPYLISRWRWPDRFMP